VLVAGAANRGAAELEHPTLWIDKLRRIRYGGKSEKLDHQFKHFELQLRALLAGNAEAGCGFPTVDSAPSAFAA
jgi:hypothetical protein